MSPPRRKAGAAKRKAGRKPARGSARPKAAKRPAAKRGASAGRKKAAASKAAKRKKATPPKKAAVRGKAKAPKKAPVRKQAAAPKKAAAAKKVAAPKRAASSASAPKPEPALRKPARTPRRGRPRKRPPVQLTEVLRRGPGPVSRLGTKYLCFSCEAKFYDLNRPEPVCPKCGVDQRDKPKEGGKPGAPAATRRAAVRPMAPLLDDDEGAVREEEIDLGVESTEVAAGGDFLDNAIVGEEAEDDSEDR